ncbi:hypothetical protein GCM10023335_74880 [Streptomyces siamensis]|uniref:Transposase n=1 Tax=Streptomyces siamensis TaxID=1274986 RepID=A0ABP9JI63_9ACTN
MVGVVWEWLKRARWRRMQRSVERWRAVPSLMRRMEQVAGAVLYVLGDLGAELIADRLPQTGRQGRPGVRAAFASRPRPGRNWQQAAR